MTPIADTVENYIASAPTPRLKEMRKSERYKEILDQPLHRDFPTVLAIMNRIDREIESRKEQRAA